MFAKTIESIKVFYEEVRTEIRKVTFPSKDETLGFKDKCGQILIPTENVVELKEGKKRVATKKVFPGYVLIEMEMSDETWNLVTNIPKVTGFIGGGGSP